MEWRKSYVLATAVAFMLAAACGPAEAKTNCGKKCCTKVLGGKICEPTCKATCEIANEAEKHLPNCGGAICDAAESVKNEAKQFVDNTLQEANRAAEHIIEEAGRGLENLEEAAHAIGKFAERQLDSAGERLSDAERRVREGKVIDAIWHFNTDGFRDTEENAALAAQESSLLNTVGQVAATAYGRPGGAAAYAAWYTYKETGDAELAIRVGIITGATSAALGEAGHRLICSAPP